MKPIIKVSAIVLLTGFVGCESHKKDDAIRIADERNEDKFGNTQKESDAAFVVDAVAASYAEIAFVQLASLNSVDSALQRKVRSFESDHARILLELQGYAKRHLITIPVQESAGARKELQLLKDAKSDDFDGKLCAVMREHHQEEIRIYEICMSRTEDAELKNWISVTLPLLNDHLKVIKDHQSSMNGSLK